MAQVRGGVIWVRGSTFFRYENVVASNSFTSSAVSGTMLASRSASASSSCHTQGAGMHSGDQLRASGRAARRRSTQRTLAFTHPYADTPAGPHAFRMSTQLARAGAATALNPNAAHLGFLEPSEPRLELGDLFLVLHARAGEPRPREAHAPRQLRSVRLDVQRERADGGQAEHERQRAPHSCAR